MLLWDGFGLQSTHSGIGRYALEIAEGLETLDRSPLILPSVPNLDPAFKRFQAPLLEYSWGRIKPLSLHAAGRQAGEITRNQAGPHIFHGLSNYNIPKLPSSFRKVLTVHDLIPFLSKDGVSTALRYYLHYQMPKAVAAADRIVCVSQWTADCLASIYPQAKSKIQVILNGRPPLLELRQDGTNRKLRIFSLCRGETYKRLSLIPEILQELPESYEWQLLTDSRGMDALGSIPRLTVYKSLPDDAVRDLWNRAQIFVHPSLWEGYCLPAASALSSCIPCVYTGGSGIDEVVGNAGIQMKATDSPKLWARAIEELAQDPRSYRERCHKQWASLPSWQDVAGQFLDLYGTLA